MKMKKRIWLMLVLLTVCLLCCATAEEDRGVKLNGEHFPDDVFWKTVKRFDRNDNGYLSAEEIERITVVDLQGKGAESLKGIEYLTSLEVLNCENNQLTELDLSANTELTSLYCAHNQLKKLNVQNNAMLENLDCEENQLTELNLTGNTELVSLKCGKNQMEELKLSQNTNLVTLYCQGNYIKALDLTQNTELAEADCDFNWLEELDVSGCSNLINLSCAYGSLEKLNVSQCTELEKLFCEMNLLKELDISRNAKLKELYCENNKLTKLDISRNARLKILYCGDNAIRELDIGKCPDLRILDCENCGLAELDISGCKALVDLTDKNEPKLLREALEWSIEEADGRHIKRVKALMVNWNTKICKGNREYVESEIPEPQYVKIDEEHFPDRALRELVGKYDRSRDGLLGEFEISGVRRIELSKENITTLKGIEYLTALEHLDCDSNELTELDVSRNTKLTYLSCGGNKLKTLDLSQNIQLKEIYCYQNELTELDVSRNTELKDIDCARNKLTELDVDKNTKLEELQCNHNQILKLNVNNNPAMEKMIISMNQLTELDISECRNLRWLWCDNNRLTELDVSNNLKLSNLRCESNGMKKLVMNNNARLEDLACTGNQLTELDISTSPALIALLENGNPTETDEDGLLWITRHGWGTKELQTDKNTKVYTGTGTAVKIETEGNKDAYPDVLYDDMKRKLWEFFCKWAQGDADNMPRSFMPEQSARMEKTKALVKELLGSGTPLSYQINSVEGKTGDDRLKYTCTVLLETENGTLQYKRMAIKFVKAGTGRGVFYNIDSDSLMERQATEADPTVKTIMLDKETIIHDQLAFYGEVVDELQPIGISCEDNGIRIELLAALRKENSVYFYYTVKDLEGKYADYSFYEYQQLGDCWGGTYSYSHNQLYYDRKEHMYYFMEHLTYLEGIDDQSAYFTFGTSYIQFWQNAWADLMALMKEYGETTQYTQGPERIRDVYYKVLPNPEEIKILDCSHSEPIQLLPNTVITGMGWIDDQLHVQVCTDETVSQLASFDGDKTGAEYGTAKESSNGRMQWKTNGKAYMEYIFDYKREEADTLNLYVHLDVEQVEVKGDWHIELPLDMILEKAEPEDETKGWTDLDNIPEETNGWIDRDYFPYEESKIWIDEDNFPDEVFREEIALYDMNEDGSLSATEMEAITSISLPGMGISTLKGIEYLTQLTYLDCRDNKLTELDVSNNKELVTLLCTGNQLTNLDLSNNEALAEAEIN